MKGLWQKLGGVMGVYEDSKKYLTGDISREEFSETVSAEGNVVQMVVVAATLVIGIFVVAEINGAIPSIGNADLSTARNQTVTNVGSGFQLGAIIPLVIAAAVIMMYIMGLRR